LSWAGFTRAVDRVTGLFGAVAEAALLVLLLLVGHEVFLRYVLDSPTQYSVELSEYLLVLITFFAAAHVLRADRHVRVLFAVARLPRRIADAAAVFSYGLVIAFCLVLVWYGGKTALTALAADARASSLLAVPLWIPYGFIPVGALALALQCAVQLGEAWRRWHEDGDRA